MTEHRKIALVICAHHKPYLAMSTFVSVLAQDLPGVDLDIHVIFNLGDGVCADKQSYEAYGERSLGEVRTLLVLSVGLYAFVFALGTLGLTLGRSAGAGSFAVAAAAPLLILHVLANASPRYRVPLLPLLLIGSGVAACQWRGIGARLRHPRAIPAVAILLFFLWFSVPSFAPDAAKLWTRGTVFEPRSALSR